MALIDTVRRLARLGFYFGLGAVSAAFDACGDGSSPTPDAPDTTAEASDDATTAEDTATAEDGTTAEDTATPEDVAVEDDATAPDEASPEDGAADDGEDLWDIVCE
jgi:hypothetical protein